MERLYAQLFHNAHCEIGEGPVYDEIRNVLYWVDITGRSVNSLALDTGEYSRLDTGRTVGCIVLRENGGILAGMDDGVYAISDIAVTPFCQPAGIMDEQRLNDGKCDKNGRMFVGIMHMPKDGPKGSLYRIDPSGKCDTILRGVGCSNGMAWSGDNKKMYYIDTLLYEPTYVQEFSYDEDTGDISDPRIVIDYSSPMLDTPGSSKTGVADGMTIDSEGMLWIAEWEGSKVSRFDPNTGEKLAEIVLPVSKPTCCTFGGRDMATLFITTASVGCENEPNAGGVFMVRPGATGVCANRFKG